MRRSVSSEGLSCNAEIMAQPERRRVDTVAYLGWVLVAFLICSLCALGFGGRGILVAAFVASLFLSRPAFIKEE